MLARRVLLSLLFVSSFALAAGAQSSPASATDKPALPEMWVKLTNSLNSSKLKEGDTIRAKAPRGWIYLTCGVEPDTLLEGRVVSIKPWSDASKTAEVALSFTAVCMNKETQPLVLIAVFYPTEDDKSAKAIQDSMPRGIADHGAGMTPYNPTTLPTEGAGDEIFPLAKFGEVSRLHHLTLAVGKGPQGATVLSTTEKRLSLAPGTRMALIPVPVKP
jgi:hypothetical protein